MLFETRERIELYALLGKAWMIQRFLWVACSIVLILVVTGSPKASDGMKKAKQHFVTAEAHYKLGRFAEALQEYSKAYEFASLPAFLFNMGQCHRQLGNHERAVFFYEGYLRESPKAGNREIVRRLIQESQEAEKQREQLRAEQERKQVQAQKEKEEKERLRLENEHKLAVERARLEALALASKKQKPVEQPPAFYQKWWFWTIVGGAVLAIAGGTALAMSADDTMVLPGGSLGTLDLRGAGP